MSTASENAPTRVDPFASADADDPLADFSTKSPREAKRNVDIANIDQLAEKAGFPSRAAPTPDKAGSGKAKPAAPALVSPGKRPTRRYTTGRNQQVNLKATQATIELLNDLADRAECTLAEVLERALGALDPLVPPRAKATK